MDTICGKNILIVEDDLMLREVLCDIFRIAGADVHEAYNGTQALALVQKNKYDIVFSDIRMRGGDGITLAKKISEFKGFRPIVFICSGYSDLTSEMHVKSEVAMFFEKPFDHRSLLREVSRFLEKLQQIDRVA